MNRRPPYALLLLAAALPAAAEEAATAPDYRPLLPAAPASATGDNRLTLGVANVNDDNAQFGQYNGLSEQGSTVVADLDWRDSGGDWQLTLSDLGLDTREGELRWAGSDDLRLTLGFDSQLQVKNDSGRTPFRGDSLLVLPGDWVSASTTDGFTNLDGALRDVSQELSRDRLFAGLQYRINNQWQLAGNVAVEDREGTRASAGGIYVDAVTADAVYLPQPVDYRSTEFDLGLGFTGERLLLEGSLAWSDFDNRDDLLTWQNPYSGYGPAVRYPAGYGGLGLAPDNDQFSGRITGQYLFSPTARLQFDGSLARLSQDDSFADWTVSPAIDIHTPLPRDSLDGSIDTGHMKVALLLQPLPKLQAKLYYQARERDYDTPRDGYAYVRGDAGSQPGDERTVYNMAYDYLASTSGMEWDWRLPFWRSRLSLDYAYEEVERRNAAVENTEEDTYTLGYRLQPFPSLTLNLSYRYADRAAGTYEWDQHYYALLDVSLINATPPGQRYINHPELSQYHLANRERDEVNIDLSWAPGDGWLLALDLLWREDHYDATNLGLYFSEQQRAHASLSYAITENFDASAYAGLDRYRGRQAGRAFRGGPDKEAFAVYPPLPQASDPSRDWELDSDDNAVTAGASLNWRPMDALALTFSYHYVDTDSEQALRSVALPVSDLPDVSTRLHQLEAGGSWQLNERWVLGLDYRYYRYDSDDWAYPGALQTMDKVLSFGESPLDESIHYAGLTATYRW